jgi:hypothetical protein
VKSSSRYRGQKINAPRSSKTESNVVFTYGEI